MPATFRAAIPPRLDALRGAVGLPPDPDLASLERYLWLSPFPPSLRLADAIVPPTQQVLQPAPGDSSGDEREPDWLTAPRDRPLIYATLGTAQAHRADLFGAILAGLRDEPVELVATVGREQDPHQFGAQPPHVHVERYIPQSLLYPHCTAVVMHGGSGTMMGALSHGLPLVLLPLSADQPVLAQLCLAHGAAVPLPPQIFQLTPDGLPIVVPDRLTPEDVREAVRAVLTQPAYRDHARRLQAEIAALPAFEQGVRLLERLARSKTPLHAGSLAKESG
jgi:MGT family glycosyltransferase